ncbi:hypothetical protein R3P38DRAFT_3201607 [Favolaschia claudopus]|uniref:Uncharacterized protein n=1 Tax=Favolaschia claudopus TaxID=2862362 RepID=A0AAW0AUP5_9AGAR
MDSFYPHNEAADLVQIWSLKASNEDAPLVKAGLSFPAYSIDSDLLKIKKFDGGDTAKVYVSDLQLSEKRTSEGIFSVVGVLCAKELPPVKKHVMNPKRVPYIRQHAGIVGYGALVFEQSLMNLSSIGYDMVVAFGSREIEGWKTEKTHAVGGPELSSSCRYFTVGKNTPDNSKVAFPSAVDPFGVLSSYVNETVNHCFDNDVMYMQYNDKTRRCMLKDPATFQLGDVVEMGVSLVTWKTGRNNTLESKYTTKLVLRTLTFLDGSLSRKAYIARNARPVKSININTEEVLNTLSLKRARFVEDQLHETFEGDEQETCETRRKLARMNLDDVE